MSISLSSTPEVPGLLEVINGTTLQFTANLGSLCTEHEIFYTLSDDKDSTDVGLVIIEITALDSDGDNIPDVIEDPDGNNLDSDQDQTPDYLDEDSDNDGIPDFMEANIQDNCVDSPADTDNDGIPDYIDLDSDNDTFSDQEEGTEDCDNDGIANYIDQFDDCTDEVIAPEVFTPNGDGQNDYFIIEGATSDDLKANELFIFNRWGGQVFHMVNYDNSWDGKSSSGTLGSNQLQEGTYFYVFKTKSGKVLKGTVYIKR